MCTAPDKQTKQRTRAPHQKYLFLKSTPNIWVYFVFFHRALFRRLWWPRAARAKGSGQSKPSIASFCAASARQDAHISASSTANVVTGLRGSSLRLNNKAKPGVPRQQRNCRYINCCGDARPARGPARRVEAYWCSPSVSLERKTGYIIHQIYKPKQLLKH